MRLYEVNDKARARLDEWGTTLRTQPGTRTHGGTLYHNYDIWVRRQHRARPVGRQAWDEWMRLCYEKTKYRTLVYYRDVVLSYDPYAN